MYYVNENIKQLYRISEGESRRGFLRLDMNENPEGLPQEFVNSVLRKVTPEFLATYPEKEPLTHLLANYFQKDGKQIGLFNGSDEAIRLIFECFSKPGGTTVAADPTFAMYRVYADMYHQNYAAISYDDQFQLDFNEFIQAIDESTNLVFALNPNNPIGTVFTDREMRDIIERAVSCNAIVVIDEAYHYFYPNSFLHYIDGYDNVIILRTFSKLLSLASVRLGVALGNEKLIEILKKASCSYNVNSLALLFGEELFKHEELIEDMKRNQLEGKAYLVTELEGAGYQVMAFEGNFIFVKPKLSIDKIVVKLYEKKVLVKTYSQSFLKDYLRISTGSKAVMVEFLELFLALDQV